MLKIILEGTKDRGRLKRGFSMRSSEMIRAQALLSGSRESACSDGAMVWVAAPDAYGVQKGTNIY